MDQKVKWLGGLLLLLGLTFLSRAGGGDPSLLAMRHYAAKHQAPPQQKDSLPPLPKGKERIFIENVDQWSYDQAINPDAQILMGNVVFKHNNGYMYCDSAYLYEQQNSFEAFGNVRFTQGDTLNIFCEYLHYDGMTMFAKLRHHVRMEHGENTLFTDSFDYNRADGVGYYFDYGTIVDTLNTLSSVYGEYTTATKQAVFNDSVKLENPNFTLYSDTLHYDTTSKIATILGPTRIVSDSGVIHTTRGVYDTQQDKAYLMDRPQLYSGKRFLTGDSLYYDRNGKRAEVYRHVIMRDTADKVELRGGYAEYHEENEHGMARDSAYCVDYSSTDTLWMHAIEMQMVCVDSVAKTIKGLGNVRVFRHDIQAVADTMSYHTGDSILRCIGAPFIWNGATQINGDTIIMYMRQGDLKEAHVGENAIVAQRLDRVHINQMRGNLLKAYLTDKKLDSIRVEGNAETIYYSMEADSTLSAHIKTQSAAIFMRFINEDIDHFKLIDQTKGRMKPVTMLLNEDKFFNGFVWFDEARPKGFKDIFRTSPKKSNEGDAPNEETPPPPLAQPIEQPIEPKRTE